MPDLEVAPPELLAAAGPLHEVASMLAAVAGDRAGMERLGEGSPSSLMRAALGRFLAQWGQEAWELASDADWLSDLLRRAAQTYVVTDQTLAEGLAR